MLWIGANRDNKKLLLEFLFPFDFSSIIGWDLNFFQNKNHSIGKDVDTVTKKYDKLLLLSISFSLCC